MPKQKMRGGDYMEPNKELKFGGDRPSKKERIEKRSDNQVARITARKRGESAKAAMKASGASNKTARLTGKQVRKSSKAMSVTPKGADKNDPKTLTKQIKKSDRIMSRFEERKANVKAREDKKSAAKKARKMEKGGPRRKAVAGATVAGAGQAMKGIGTAVDAIAGRETGAGKALNVGGDVVSTAGSVMGPDGAAVNAAGGALNSVAAGAVEKGITPDQQTAPATPTQGTPTAADASVEQAVNKPMKKGGKKRKKYQEGGTKKMKKQKAPQLAMSPDTRNEDQKYFGVKSDSRAMTKREKDSRFRDARHIKMPLSVKNKKYKAGGAKPDYLDMDKDGNKTESMKSAIKDRRKRGGKR